MLSSLLARLFHPQEHAQKVFEFEKLSSSEFKREWESLVGRGIAKDASAELCWLMNARHLGLADGPSFSSGVQLSQSDAEAAILKFRLKHESLDQFQFYRIEGRGILEHSFMVPAHNKMYNQRVVYRVERFVEGCLSGCSHDSFEVGGYLARSDEELLLYIPRILEPHYPMPAFPEFHGKSGSRRAQSGFGLRHQLVTN